ncbi:hypothetical protein ACROYT_G012279 [Oculina patagonica]
MNGFVLLSASTFIYFTYHILDQGLCEASTDGFQRDPSNKLRFAQFKDHFYHVLDVPRVEGVTVQTWRHCLLRCVKNDQCFSTNVGAFPLPNGNIPCELLPTDKYNASGKFKANHTFHHFSIVSPCESFPCQHGGTCKALYETNDYNCTCTPNYIGSNCEMCKASSCKEMYECGFHESKAYPLQTDIGQVLVYCHMTLPACGGGQWTPVMKINGSKTTFRFRSSLWSDMNTFNTAGGSTGFDFEETKLPTYWNTPFTKICLGMKIEQQTRFIVINQTASSLYSIMANDQYRATSLGRDTWKSLAGEDASLEPYCDKEGFNVVCGMKVRIGIVGNDANLCTQCGSYVAFGVTLSVPPFTGNRATGISDNGYKRTEAMGYILIQ